tara:strand:- start:317 stop:478 length:162 start_codon:yes stop_codon:yes gene_type:complete
MVSSYLNLIEKRILKKQKLFPINIEDLHCIADKKFKFPTEVRKRAKNLLKLIN